MTGTCPAPEVNSTITIVSALETVSRRVIIRWGHVRFGLGFLAATNKLSCRGLFIGITQIADLMLLFTPNHYRSASVGTVHADCLPHIVCAKNIPNIVTIPPPTAKSKSGNMQVETTSRQCSDNGWGRGADVTCMSAVAHPGSEDYY